MKLNDYVIKNKQIITWLENKDHNSEFLGKYYGTLDYATARFHTILIKLSQDKIKVINDFYRYTVKYSNASILLRWYYKNCLHGLGINQIPKVKKLLNSLDN